MIKLHERVPTIDRQVQGIRIYFYYKCKDQTVRMSIK